MKKKLYTTPNAEVIELQGEVVMAAVSGENTINESDPDIPEININSGNMGSGSASGGMSSSYFDIWDDEQ